MPNYLTPRAVSQKLGVGLSTVYDWLHSGALPCVTLSPRVRLIDPKVLAKFVPPERGRPKLTRKS